MKTNKKDQFSIVLGNRFFTDIDLTTSIHKLHKNISKLTTRGLELIENILDDTYQDMPLFIQTLALEDIIKEELLSNSAFTLLGLILDIEGICMFSEYNVKDTLAKKYLPEIAKVSSSNLLWKRLQNEDTANTDYFELTEDTDFEVLDIKERVLDIKKDFSKYLTNFYNLENSNSTYVTKLQRLKSNNNFNVLSSVIELQGSLHVLHGHVSLYSDDLVKDDFFTNVKDDFFNLNLKRNGKVEIGKLIYECELDVSLVNALLQIEGSGKLDKEILIVINITRSLDLNKVS